MESVNKLLQAWIEKLSTADGNAPVTNWDLYQMLLQLQQEINFVKKGS